MLPRIWRAHLTARVGSQWIEPQDAQPTQPTRGFADFFARPLVRHSRVQSAFYFGDLVSVVLLVSLFRKTERLARARSGVPIRSQFHRGSECCDRHGGVMVGVACVDDEMYINFIMHIINIPSPLEVGGSTLN
eukprot:scaffold24335_cov33-Tisochrysis_lutea.AAC.1